MKGCRAAYRPSPGQRDPCRSGGGGGGGRKAAPAISAAQLKSWGRFAPLSRHKAAPTRGASA
ncbi:hypothetical protein EFK07_30145 [Pseudomonas putida]|uniref:Uncharacterized protein n=1 Tax=Pseudomonas putida TaxID=303 RepID=A0A3M8SAB8_PSEPU|nr:hypothetical protein EFK07_30145 [Pseudomonas putida]